MTLLEAVDQHRPEITGERVDGAATVAAYAAESAGVEVRSLDGIEELRLGGALFSQVWEFSSGDEPKVPVDLLRALSHAGGYLAGAWVGTELVGASLGFSRLGQPHACLHSHITGVSAGSAGAGVGRALKLHQRHWALERAIPEIVWTFDPLVRRNAYFNVTKLGALIVDYYEDFYGPMPDGLNRRDMSDRCLTRWPLLDARVDRAITDGGLAAASLPEEAAVVLSPERKLTPMDLVGTSQPVFVWVPEDIVAIRRSDPAEAARWRTAVRQSLGVAVRFGWTVSIVSADGWYQLEPPAPERRGPR